MRMMALSRPCGAIALAIVLIAPALAQDDFLPRAQDRPPGPALSPSDAMKLMTVPPGFAVELVASEPHLVNPVAMTFDEKGRAWVTESLEYPRQSPGKGRDRVQILEDTDGDGRADKFTIFADGLNIPSGVAVGYGGVWVANSPDILFYPDADRDGHADGPPQVVVSGFGREDTHELPNSLTWGPDGWLYGWNGVFNPAHIEYRGETFDFTCAIFRIHPRTREFQVWCEGTSNPWGIAFNESGDAFASACVIDHFWHLTESGYYHRQGGPYPPFTWKLESIVDFNHQKAAYCGVHYYDSTAYPESYRGKFYMGNIHGNCINADSVVKAGATYKAIQQDDFLSANDAWFMPVVQKTGPDGSLYILDWYDRYHCYQDANRDPKGVDRLKGRLYRVRYKDTPRRANFDLGEKADDELIALLASGNGYDRDIAQRLLAERGPAVQGRLIAAIADAKAPVVQKRHATWALIGSGPIELEPHRALLNAADPTIRAFAVRAAGNMGRVDPAIGGAVKKLASDPDPSVRLQVAIASKKIDGLDPMPVLLEVLSNADDVVTPPVVWRDLEPSLETGAYAFLSASEKFAGSKAVEGIYPRVIERFLARRATDAGPIATLFARLSRRADEARAAGRDEDGPIRDVLVLIANKVQSGEITGARLESLRTSLNAALPGGIPTEGPVSPSLIDFAILATSWKDPAAIGLMREAVSLKSRQSMATEDQRLRAIAALISIGDGRILDAVGTILADPEDGSPDFRGKALAALGRLDNPKVAAVVLDAYPKLEPATRPGAIELLTQRASWSRALIDAVKADAISKDAVNVTQIRKLQGVRDGELAKLAKDTFGIVREGRSPERDKVIARMRDHVRATKGDPIAGRKVFAKLCAQCHKIYGEGQEVGPDITRNGRNDFEQLLSNVFDPSLVIGQAYRATTVATADGRVLTGLLAEDSPRRIVLKIQGGKAEVIPRADVDEIKTSPLSLMPEDIEKQLSDREWADLFGFLILDRPPGDPEAKTLPGASTPGAR